MSVLFFIFSSMVPMVYFFKLSKKCYKINASEFHYDVCPYARVDQQSKVSVVVVVDYKKYKIKLITYYLKCVLSMKGNTMSIGTRPVLKNENSKWTLHMENGESRFCSHPRRSKVILFSFQEIFYFAKCDSNLLVFVDCVRMLFRRGSSKS